MPNLPDGRPVYSALDASYFEAARPKPTGNTLVHFHPSVKPTSAARTVTTASGYKVAHAKDFSDDGRKVVAEIKKGNAVYFDAFNVAVVPRREAAATSSMAAAFMAKDDVKSARPEFYLFAASDLRQRYAAWVSEGLRILSDSATTALVTGPVPAEPAVARAAAEPDLTWGIKAVAANRSRFTGKGIKLAILDTGFDLNHPDFVGRKIVGESFVQDVPVQDVKGHGTHVTGTAAGPLASTEHARYGVAYEADIYMGKVLDDKGSGEENWIIAGITWAIEQGCEIISMSLVRPTQPDEAPDEIYEDIGRTALEKRCLIIAAAGNESARRFGFIAPVGSPANATSIMAAAVDSNFQIANFSCGGINPKGGEINIAGPGVDVFSSFPMPERYKRLPGTSMATPHVAGVAALWAESDSNLRGQALWDQLKRSALNIGLAPGDVGAGLVQSPP